MAIRDNLGGGGAVLDSLEEIAANTEPGKHAGALAVKELTESLEEVNNNLGELSSVKIDSGKIVTSTNTVTVNFTKKFTERPAVTASVVASGNALFATITESSKTSATFKVWKGESAHSGSWTLNWIAVGK